LERGERERGAAGAPLVAGDVAAVAGALDELLATRPLVSVVIPSFERYDYLVNAIHSVRRQVAVFALLCQ
jgi:hypothetical protein